MADRGPLDNANPRAGCANGAPQRSDDAPSLVVPPPPPKLPYPNLSLHGIAPEELIQMVLTRSTLDAQKSAYTLSELMRAEKGAGVEGEVRQLVHRAIRELGTMEPSSRGGLYHEIILLLRDGWDSSDVAVLREVALNPNHSECLRCLAVNELAYFVAPGTAKWLAEQLVRAPRTSDSLPYIKALTEAVASQLKASPAVCDDALRVLMRFLHATGPELALTWAMEPYWERGACDLTFGEMKDVFCQSMRYLLTGVPLNQRKLAAAVAVRETHHRRFAERVINHAIGLWRLDPEFHEWGTGEWQDILSGDRYPGRM